MDDNLRSFTFDDQPLAEGGERPPTECQAIFTITSLPDELRTEVVRAMVDSANRYLHSLDVYPCPQLEHEVVGLDVPCPSRVYGTVNPYNASRVVQRTAPEADVEADALRVARAIETTRVRTTVESREPPISLYVDPISGRDDGHGTVVSPFKSLARARAHARMTQQRALIRNLSGGILATYGCTAPGDSTRPAASRNVPAALPRAALSAPPPRTPVNINPRPASPIVIPPRRP